MDRDNRSEDTRLLYCTTGILKNRLIRSQHMNDYTHIILDEVHERELETDFLLLVVRKFLHSNSPNVKVSHAFNNLCKTCFEGPLTFTMENGHK